MWMSGTDFTCELLYCHRVNATAKVAKKHRKKWLPVSGEILRSPAD